ncbi:MAG: ABC-F family ATP-binding cassette domain-containing protein [Candidatus Omnitrophota bacterium]
MIAINNVSKNYGQKTLFENISLNINQGEKIGLVGPNGAGKSTFFHLVMGTLEPSSGFLQVNKGTRVGYLPQESSFHSERSVLQEILEGDETLQSLKCEKLKLEEEEKAGSMRYGEILHELEVLGFFELEHKSKKILAGLGFKESDFLKPITHLSGGWQMRVLLAKLLTYHYDLLLLDEPTNYLDLNAALWLKDYLGGFKGTFIMISHDKDFLTDVTNYTLILEHGAIAKVKGSYHHYEQIKEERYVHLSKQFAEQEKKRKQLQTFVSRFHAQPNKAAAVRNKKKALERMDEIVLPPDPMASIRNFHFPQTRPSGQTVITLEKVCKSYGDVTVYRDFDFEISKGDKAVLAGENGAGKSTLLKILSGAIDIDSGQRKVGYHVDIGYFSQTRLDTLNMANSVLQEAYSAAPGSMAQESIRTILGAFLFSGDDVEKKVSVLSGGEKSRLNLAKFLINPPNFLLLDEPTTHLDVDAVEALVRALKSYEGTLVFISHDIHFVRSMANVVYEVKQGSVRKFFGNFDYYMEKREEEGFIPLGRAKKKGNDAAKEEAKLARQKTKEEEKHAKEEERARKAHNTAIGARIQKLRKRQEDLQLESYAKARALADPRIYRDEERAKEYGRRLKEIEKLMVEIDKEVQQLEEGLK